MEKIASTKEMSRVRLAAVSICLLLSAVFVWINGYGYLTGAHPPLSGLGRVLGHDFVNTWMFGKAALNGKANDWFDVHVYRDTLQKMFHLSTDAADFNWSYPPSIMLFSWPFGFLPYIPALLIFLGLSLATFAAVVRPSNTVEWLLVIFSPVAITDMFAGQSGFWFAALILGALALWDRKPVFAGILIGLLTIKPQLGFLFPVALIASKNWTALIAAAATAIILFALTSAIFGLSVWSGYVHNAVSYQITGILKTQQLWFHARAMPTPYMTVLSLYGSRNVATAVQMLSAGLGAIAIWVLFKNERYSAIRNDCFVILAALATPYIWAYDLIAVSWVATVYMTRKPPNHFTLLASAFTIMIPYFSQPYPFGVPGMSIVSELMLLSCIAAPYLFTRSHQGVAFQHQVMSRARQ